MENKYKNFTEYAATEYANKTKSLILKDNF